MRARATACGVLLLAGCGYAFTTGVSRLPAGAERVAVRPLANRTADAEVGGWVASALRAELARRGADGPASAPAALEGEVEEIASARAASGVWRLTLVVRAALRSGDRVLGEHRSRRTEDYAAGVDPLESEGRRRIALRRACEASAREIIERLETR